MNVLFRPIITEKTLQLARRSQYTFVVDRRANKLTIARAIQQHYRVEVAHVTVQNIRPETRRTRRGVGRTAGWKRAIATLQAKQTIPGFEIEAAKESQEAHTHPVRSKKGRS